MYVSIHHGDGHIAVWVAAAPGEQEEPIHASPEK
jgi:hypothetical protein